MARTKENLKERQKTDSIFAVYDQDGKLLHDGTADRTNKISHKEAKKNIKSRLRKAVAMELLNTVMKAENGQKKMIFGKPFTYSGGKWVSDKGGAGGKAGESLREKLNNAGINKPLDEGKAGGEKEPQSPKVKAMAEELESVMMFTPKELSKMSPKEIKSAHRDLSEDWKKRQSGKSE